MSGEKGRLDAYLNTITRLEPDITPIDAGGAYASIAKSLKRIADLMQLRAELNGAIESDLKNEQRTESND